MRKKIMRKIYPPYAILLIINLIFTIFAFTINSPEEIFGGIVRIVASPDLLITDYMLVGGIGAALVNCAIVSTICIAILCYIDVKPNGAIIMALWLTSGFSFFGKNVYNVWPAMFGVYIYSKVQKEPFHNYVLVALLSSALAPMVSQLSFLNIFNTPFERFLGVLIGIGIGLFTGFILPIISRIANRVHAGYNLYNIGFAAGLIAMFFVSFCKSIGIIIKEAFYWSEGNNFILAILLYSICTILIYIGLMYQMKDFKRKHGFRNILRHPGRLVTDFYLLYNESCYINMGILGILATTLMLIIGADLNGPTLSGIFTIIGFGAFGKTIKNVIPILIGSIACCLFNTENISSPSNVLAILFSTCLAPVAGEFGFMWGMVAGFLHVTIVMNMSYLHSGLNLYNNGFAGGFVALVLVPIIMAFRKDEDNEIPI